MRFSLNDFRPVIGQWAKQPEMLPIANFAVGRSRKGLGSIGLDWRSPQIPAWNHGHLIGGSNPSGPPNPIDG
jgi:hypothetical protein